MEFGNQLLQIATHPGKFGGRLFDCQNALRRVFCSGSDFDNISGDFRCPRGSFLYGPANLPGCHRLFFHSRSNGALNIINLVNNQSDFVDRLNCVLAVRLDGFNLMADFFCGFGRIAGQFLNLGRNDSKTLAGITQSGGFDCGV